MIQILSAISGCEKGADATGLIDPDRRADAYTDVTNAMSQILGSQMLVERKEVKEATMTAGYGSKAKPEEIFGEDTPELAAFYEATMQIAPGAAQLLVMLKETWIPFALKHSVILPDNFHAHMKVMDECESVIEVDELDHATFTLYYKENAGKESAVSNVANVTHALDAYLLRSMIRRCNYDPKVLTTAVINLQDRALARACGEQEATLNEGENDDLMIYLERYDATGIADAVIFPLLTDFEATAYLTDDHIAGLRALAQTMSVHKPFPITSVHDESTRGSAA